MALMFQPLTPTKNSPCLVVVLFVELLIFTPLKLIFSFDNFLFFGGFFMSPCNIKLQVTCKVLLSFLFTQFGCFSISIVSVIRLLDRYSVLANILIESKLIVFLFDCHSVLMMKLLNFSLYTICVHSFLSSLFYWFVPCEFSCGIS